MEESRPAVEQEEEGIGVKQDRDVTLAYSQFSPESVTHWDYLERAEKTIVIEKEKNRRLQEQLNEKDKTIRYYEKQMKDLTKYLLWICTVLGVQVKETEGRGSAKELHAEQLCLLAREVVAAFQDKAIVAEEKWTSIIKLIKDYVKQLVNTHPIFHCVVTQNLDMKNQFTLLCRDIIQRFDNEVVDVLTQISGFLCKLNSDININTVEAEGVVMHNIQSILQIFLTVGEGILQCEPHQIAEKLPNVQFCRNIAFEQSINIVNNLKTKSGCPLLTFALMISSCQGRVIPFSSAAQLLADVITNQKSFFPRLELPSTKDDIIEHFVTPEKNSEESCMAPLVETGMITLRHTIQGENVATLCSLNKSLKCVAAWDDLFEMCNLIMITFSYRFRQGHVVAASKRPGSDSMVLYLIDGQSEDFKCSPFIFMDVCKVSVYTLTEYGREVLNQVQIADVLV